MAKMGFTFNGRHCSDLGVKVKEVAKSILPSLENQATDIKYGGWHTGIRVAPREIKISIYIDGISFYSYEEKVREVAEWLYSETPQPLYLDEEDDRYYMAILDGDTEIEQVLWYGEVELTFICYNPFAIATKETSVVGTENNSTHLYRGNARCFPVMELHYNSTIEKPWFSIGDKVLGIQARHEGGGTFVINCDTGNITKDGKPALTLLAVNSEYPFLMKGINKIDTNADSWKLTYRAKYL